MDSICPICGIQIQGFNSNFKRHVQSHGDLPYNVRKEYLQRKKQGDKKSKISPQSAATVKNIVNYLHMTKEKDEDILVFESEQSKLVFLRSTLPFHLMLYFTITMYKLMVQRYCLNRLALVWL